ncbi:MAG TPA: hypothetical protein VFW68_01885 [Rhodocyclaceae bacterium]|nr:hypothetical protein [Rhodocyclaceae bacterium]
MKGKGSQVIHLHRDAPPKPALGASCNGCGVCCAMVTCPVALILFRRRRGPCPALVWSEGETRYHCGLVTTPNDYLRWLPKTWAAPARRWMLRWIASGVGCDADYMVEP